jgi:hypothetical protein
LAAKCRRLKNNCILLLKARLRAVLFYSKYFSCKPGFCVT